MKKTGNFLISDIVNDVSIFRDISNTFYVYIIKFKIAKIVREKIEDKCGMLRYIPIE